jgi:hypothetical protein
MFVHCWFDLRSCEQVSPEPSAFVVGVSAGCSGQPMGVMKARAGKQSLAQQQRRDKLVT